MTRVLIATALTLATAVPAFAEADKTHQQIMAEIRMLQEQQQQLQQTLAALGDTLKVVTAKLDEQSGVSRKAFADQKLLIDNAVEGVRILREKSDDTNVRLSVMTQEMESFRQALASMPAPTAPAATDPGGGVPPAGVPPGATQPAPTPPAPASGAGTMSPSRLFETAYSDYVAGQYELAVVGFEQYIRSYPQSVQADDAQFNIGNAYYQAGKFKEALAAFQKVTSDYPQSDSVPAAYFKMGATYEAMKQLDLARKAYETVIQRFPTVVEYATLAKQSLDRLNRK